MRCEDQLNWIQFPSFSREIFFAGTIIPEKWYNKTWSLTFFFSSPFATPKCCVVVRRYGGWLFLSSVSSGNKYIIGGKFNWACEKVKFNCLKDSGQKQESTRLAFEFNCLAKSRGWIERFFNNIQRQNILNRAHVILFNMLLLWFFYSKSNDTLVGY